MSVEAITWALKQPVPQSSTKFVLVVLANCASGDTFLAFPSVAYLAESTAQDRKTVLKNLGRLRDFGLIEDTGRRAGKTQQVVIYRVNCGAAGLFDNSPKTGTVPFCPANSPVFSGKQSQKRDTETSVTVNETKPKLAPLRGTRLTQGWAPSDELARWAIHQCADNPRAMLTEVDKFNDYWAGIAGAKGVKLDWDATFRNWIRKAADDINNRGTKHAAAHRPSAIERVEANIRAGQQRDGRAIVDGEAQRLIG